MAHLALCLSAFVPDSKVDCLTANRENNRKRVCPRQHPSWWLDAGKIFSIAKPDKSHTPHPSYLMACFSADQNVSQLMKVFGRVNRKEKRSCNETGPIRWSLVLKVNCLSQTTQEKTQEFWHPTNTKLQNVLPWSWSVPKGSIAILQDFRHKIRFQWFSSLCTVTQYHHVPPEV